MADLVGNPNCWFCHAQAQFLRHDMLQQMQISLKPDDFPKSWHPTLHERRGEKTDFWSFGPGPTQTGLRS